MLKVFGHNYRGTGSVIQQPRAKATITGFHFDASLNYQDDGFLDAPGFIPSGGAKALDCEDICLALTHVEREPGAYGSSEAA